MSKVFKKSTKLLYGPLLLVALVAVSLWSTGCSEKTAPVEPIELQEQVLLSPTDPAVRAAIKVQERHEEELLQNPGFVGTGIGATEDGRPALVILLKDANVLAKAAPLPEEIESIPVVPIVTGEFKALDFDPTAKHRPAPNGVSIGHPNITAGTLGCLVERGARTFILSNNHVMANENNAHVGDPILQPGPADGGQNPADRIAELSAFKRIDFSGGDNVIDAAIAIVRLANVTGATEPAGYGKPKMQTADATIGTHVLKYGRTTKQTSGTVSAINVTSNVTYSSGVARFVGQILITPGSFSAGGDSGSLVVIRGGSNARKPIGLLFAGSATSTLANPIDKVLDQFHVKIIGN